MRTKRSRKACFRLSKYAYTKAIEFANPPVSFELAGFNRTLLDQNVRISVIARAYDFGVLSLAFHVPVPQNTSFSALETAAKMLDSDRSFDVKAGEYITQLISDFSDAIPNPSVKENFIEDYMVFLIESLDRKMDSAEFLKQYDPSRLLLYETLPVSDSIREDTLKFRFSYYPEDLVILHLDNAFIIEPSMSSDILDILEFANAQILELRYYDYVLDKEMSRIYGELPKRRGVSIFKLRTYERLAKKITRTVTELTEVTEKVDNALKVTKDVYYAKIYRAAMMLFRSSDWELSIKEKLQIVINSYRMLYNEISTKRAYLIELGIFLLIVFEIILFVMIEW